MSNEPLVSICLCTYNGEKFLAEQLTSILEQTYSNFELVIVDDSSEDSTYQLLQRYTDPRIRLYQNEQNLGYAGNFGKALLLSKGELIALADQDDIWLPEKIKLMVDNINHYSGIYHDSAFITDSGHLKGRCSSDQLNHVQGREPKSLLLNNYVSGHAMMVKRDVLDQALPIPKGIYHDWWLSFVCMNMDGMAYLEKSLVKYRIHESNQTVLARISSSVSSTDPTSLKRYKKIRKAAETILVLKAFLSLEIISDKLRFFIQDFIRLERRRLKTCFSFNLFFFLLSNITIYKSRRRGFFGKLNIIRKDSRGINV